MSYYTLMDGSITVEPPITWQELQRMDDGTGKFSDAERGYTEIYRRAKGGPRNALRLALLEEDVEAFDGTLRRKWVEEIQPLSSDPRGAKRGHAARAELQEILGRYRFTCSGTARSFTGVIEGSGEEPLDVWRLRVRDGEAEIVTPVITWPED